MASRDDILRAVRSHLPPPVNLPEIEARGIVYADRLKQFAAMVEAVGGRCIFAADAAEVNRTLAAMPEVMTALKIVSLVGGIGVPTESSTSNIPPLSPWGRGVGGEGVSLPKPYPSPPTPLPQGERGERTQRGILNAGPSNVEINDINDPHDLADVDFAVLPGRFGVAENGGVWVTDDSVKHRVIFFIAQHVALVLPIAEILDNMHQAYERLAFDKPGFGAFISGPSKTADIEQSLVIGAHGPRSLTVFCVGRRPQD